MPGLLNRASITALKSIGFKLKSFEFESENGHSRVFYVTYGENFEEASATTLVFYPGYGDSIYLWAPILMRFARHFGEKVRVFGLDFPGYAGLSKHPSEDRCFDFEDYESLSEQFLRDVVGGQCQVLIGNSMGGWIATRTIIADPTLAKELVLLNPGGILTVPEDMFRIKDMFHIKRYKDFWKLIKQIFYRMPRIAYPFGFLFRYYRMSKKHSFRHVLESISEPHFVNEGLATVKNPIHVLWGTADRLMPAEMPMKWKELGPSVELHLIDRCGHMPQLERPRQVYKVVDELVKKALLSKHSS